ncbi:MAG: helix-turn-helix domain-containing protein [Gemmatimonadaceae bacterium]|nr:helix-turn-helix domain-containing protein [Gemmatimonadaceae bacterium]
MGFVATLLPNSTYVQRLREGLRDHFTLVPCATWGELLGTCAREAVSVAVVGLFSPNETSETFDWLRQLERRFPSVTVVAYTAIPPARPRDLFEAGRFGIEGLIIEGEDDAPARLRALVEQAEARGLLDLLRPAMAAANPLVRDALLVAVTRAHQRLSPERLARILGVRRKVLAARLAEERFPTTQRLIAWGRLLVAAKLLEDGGRTADSVAAALGFPSGSAFRNTCQRYLHAAPLEVRSSGGARFAVDAFVTACRSGAMRPVTRRGARAAAAMLRARAEAVAS